MPSEEDVVGEGNQAMRLGNYGAGILVGVLAYCFSPPLMAQSIVKQDYQIDSTDASIKLFVRMKMQEGNSRFDNGSVVVFVHGATFPSSDDFDLSSILYSWAN